VGSVAGLSLSRADALRGCYRCPAPVESHPPTFCTGAKLLRSHLPRRARQPALFRTSVEWGVQARAATIVRSFPQHLRGEESSSWKG
jgi:hypothetical protein